MASSSSASGPLPSVAAAIRSNTTLLPAAAPRSEAIADGADAAGTVEAEASDVEEAEVDSGRVPDNSLPAQEAPRARHADYGQHWGEGAARCFSIEGDFLDLDEDQGVRLMPVPDSFICPISLTIMIDPVAAVDGSIYDRCYIERWFRQRRQERKPLTSPVTGLQLTSTTLMPLAALQRAIESYLTHRPEIRQGPTSGRSFEEAAQVLQRDLFEKQESTQDTINRLREQNAGLQRALQHTEARYAVIVEELQQTKERLRRAELYIHQSEEQLVSSCSSSAAAALLSDEDRKEGSTDKIESHGGDTRGAHRSAARRKKRIEAGGVVRCKGVEDTIDEEQRTKWLRRSGRHVAQLMFGYGSSHPFVGSALLLGTLLASVAAVCYWNLLTREKSGAHSVTSAGLHGCLSGDDRSLCSSSAGVNDARGVSTAIENTTFPSHFPAEALTAKRPWRERNSGSHEPEVSFTPGDAFDVVEASGRDLGVRVSHAEIAGLADRNGRRRHGTRETVSANTLDRRKEKKPVSKREASSSFALAGPGAVQSKPPVVIDDASLRRFVELLRAGSPDERRHAAFTLWNSAVTDVDVQGLARVGAIGPLVMLLQDDDAEPDVKEAAAAVLGSLATNSAQFRVKIAKAGAIGPLINMLKSDHTGARVVAARTLWGLATQNVANQVAMVSAGAIPILVRLLDDGVTRVRVAAAAALCGLSIDHKQNQETIAAAGAIVPLVRLLREDEAGARVAAAAALRNLAITNKDNQAAVVNAGVIKPLVELLRDDEAGAQEDAAFMLANLAANNANHQNWIAKAGAVPPLIELLRNGAPEVQEAASLVLRNLAGENKPNAIAIAAAGAVEPLYRILLSGRYGAKKQAAWALWNLATADSDLLEAIARSGAVSALVDILGGDSLEAREGLAATLLKLASSHDQSRGV